MSEMLIFNRRLYFEDWDQEKIDSLLKWELDKYESRDIINDVIEERPDGYWTAPGNPGYICGYKKEKFRLVCIPGKTVNEEMNIPVCDSDTNVIRKRRFNLSTSNMQDVADMTFDGNEKSTISEEDFEKRITDKIDGIDLELLY